MGLEFKEAIVRATGRDYGDRSKRHELIEIGGSAGTLKGKIARRDKPTSRFLDEQELRNELQSKRLQEEPIVLLRCESYDGGKAISLTSHSLQVVFETFDLPQYLLQAMADESSICIIREKSTSSNGYDFILKMPRMNREELVLALASNKSSQIRAIVQGLRKHELDNILQRVKSIEGDGIMNYWVIVTELIRMLLESDSKAIVGITRVVWVIGEDLKKKGWRKPIQPFEYLLQKPADPFESYLFELMEQSGRLDRLHAGNEYILYLLDCTERLLTSTDHPDLIGTITERNSYSKRIAEKRKYDIECLQKNIQSLVSLVNHIIANEDLHQQRTDGSTIRLISILTLVFLPATFGAVFFTIPIFNWEQDKEPFLKSNRFWIYWVFAISTSVALYLLYRLYSLFHLSGLSHFFSLSHLYRLFRFGLVVPDVLSCNRHRRVQDVEADSFGGETDYEQPHENQKILVEFRKRALGKDNPDTLSAEAELYRLQRKYPIALRTACRGEDIQLVMKLLSEADVAEQDENGLTALHLAARTGRDEVVELLVEKGAEIDARDKHERTALSLAAREGKEAVVKLLVEKGAKTNVRDEDGRTALSWAAHEGKEVVVKLLVEKSADVSVVDNDRLTALHLAATTGKDKVVELLVENGAKIDAKDKDERTALHLAAEKGHREVVELLAERAVAKEEREAAVQLLLEKGGNVNGRDNNGRTLLHWAAKNGYPAVVQLLEKWADFDVNCEDRDSRAPLSWAAEFGHEAVVQLLLARGGVNPDSKDTDGRTPLSWAAVGGHGVVVGLLLEKGIDVESKDEKYGQTALSLAAEHGHEAVVRLLLKGDRVNPDSKNNGDRTPLSLAAENGHKAVMRLLVEKGADVNSKNENGQTPLFYAAAKGHEEVVQLLIEEHADVDSKDENDWTPLSYAAAVGHEATVQLLVKKGADVDSRSKDDRTPLSIATEYGHKAVEQLLKQESQEERRKRRRKERRNVVRGTSPVEFD